MTARILPLVYAPVLNTPTLRYSVQPGCGWLDPLYAAARNGMQHTGADYNDTRGRDSDLGAPVYNITDGVVEDAGWLRGWGNCVLFYHPDYAVWSMHAHLLELKVREGQKVAGGVVIGSIGKGDPSQHFWAHDHFEVRSSRVPMGAWPSNDFRDPAAAARYIRAHWFDPEKWLAEHDAIRSVMEVDARREKHAATLAAQDAPKPGERKVLVADGKGGYVNINGKRIDAYHGVAINAEDPDRVWIRPEV